MVEQFSSMWADVCICMNMKGYLPSLTGRHMPRMPSGTRVGLWVRMKNEHIILRVELDGGSTLNQESFSIWISLVLYSLPVQEWTHPESSPTHPTKLQLWDTAKPKEIDWLTNRVLSDPNHPYTGGWKPLDENCRRVQMSALRKL